MESEIQFLITCLEIAVLSYVIVWTVHYTELFYILRLWAQPGINFIQRAIGCPVCFTYHVTLATTSIAALVKDWSLFTWAIAWGLICFGTLWMNSRNTLYYPIEIAQFDEEDPHD